MERQGSFSQAEYASKKKQTRRDKFLAEMEQLWTHPTVEQLHQRGLAGMARAFSELEANPTSAALSHAEWLGLLLDREITERYERRLRATRLRFARLRHPADVEDVDYRAARGLDRALFQALIAGRGIDEAQNLIIEGPAGSVKAGWPARSATGRAAITARCSTSAPQVVRRSRAGPRRRPLSRPMRALGGVKLLILDDWGLEPLGPEQRHDMLEIVENRYGRGATLITSQIPVDRWHALIGDPTLADAILHRIIHNAHRLQLSGDSLRKQKTPQTVAA